MVGGGVAGGGAARGRGVTGQGAAALECVCVAACFAPSRGYFAGTPPAITTGKNGIFVCKILFIILDILSRLTAFNCMHSVAGCV